MSKLTPEAVKNEEQAINQLSSVVNKLLPWNDPSSSGIELVQLLFHHEKHLKLGNS